MNDHLPRLAAIGLLAGALAGCASNAPPETFYVLDDGGAVVSSVASPTTREGARDPALLGVVITGINVPELVDRPQIVTRDSTNRAVVSEQNLWGESLRAGIGRTLASRLSNALYTAGKPAQVAAAPQAAVVDPHLRVTVDVVRFDAVPNGTAVVEALYTVRRRSDNTVRTGRTSASVPITGVDYTSIVSSLNRALEQVDGEIGKLVIALADSPSAPPLAPTTDANRKPPSR